MPSLPEITAELSPKIEQAISVIVARNGADEMESHKVALADDAAEAFRDLCRDLVQRLEARTAVDYTADAELDAKEVFVVDDSDSLAELGDLLTLAANAATLPVTPPRDLDLSIQFYAVVVGDRDRILLLRRTDPQIRFRAGRFLAIAGEQLRKLDEPTFSFSPGFDLVLAKSWGVILNQTAFERLFRDIGLVDQHIGTWVTGITDHLTMDPTSIAALQDVARTDSRTWRRMREIHRRGHLASVTLDDVRRYARRVGLDPKKIVQNGQLNFDPSDRFSFLHLLNEDLYKGPLTEDTFEAQRKSRTGT